MTSPCSHFSHFTLAPPSPIPHFSTMPIPVPAPASIHCSTALHRLMNPSSPTKKQQSVSKSPPSSPDWTLHAFAASSLPASYFVATCNQYLPPSQSRGHLLWAAESMGVARLIKPFFYVLTISLPFLYYTSNICRS